MNTNMLVAVIAEKFERKLNTPEDIAELFNEICTLKKDKDIIDNILTDLEGELASLKKEYLNNKFNLRLAEKTILDLTTGHKLSQIVKEKNKNVLEGNEIEFDFDETGLKLKYPKPSNAVSTN